MFRIVLQVPTMKTRRTAQATLRLPDSLKREYEEMAEKDLRTFSQIVAMALQIAKPHLKRRIEAAQSDFRMSAAT